MGCATSLHAVTGGGQGSSAAAEGRAPQRSGRRRARSAERAGGMKSGLARAPIASAWSRGIPITTGCRAKRSHRDCPAAGRKQPGRIWRAQPVSPQPRTSPARKATQSKVICNHHSRSVRCNRKKLQPRSIDEAHVVRNAIVSHHSRCHGSSTDSRRTRDETLRLAPTWITQ